MIYREGSLSGSSSAGAADIEIVQIMVSITVVARRRRPDGSLGARSTRGTPTGGACAGRDRLP